MIAKTAMRLLCHLALFCLTPSLVVAAPPETALGEYREAKLAEGQFLRVAPPAWVTAIPVPAVLPSAEASTILLADTQFHWTDKTAAVFVHRATHANAASALQSLGQIEIDFNPEYQRIKLHALRILRGDTLIDKLSDAKVRFLERELGLENSIYTGTVTALILLEDIRVGDTLEIAYSTEGRNPVMGDKIADQASWEQLVPVQQRRISVQIPAERKLRYRFIGGDEQTTRVTPRESVSGGQREMVFEQFDIKPLRLEGAYTPWYQPASWVQFSEYENWNQVAQWGAGLFVTPQPQSAEFERLVASLKAEPIAAKRVIAALNYVQAEIRYTSVSLGENSHRPATPDEVLKRRYGDCKDKALLLVSLLRAVGIQAEPTLASLRNMRGFGLWLPSPDVFDHAIAHVKLDGHDYWLDATALQRTENLATLGQVLGLSEVLIASPNSWSLSTLALPSPEQYANEIRQIVRQERFGEPAELESVQITRGLQAEYYRRAFAEIPRDTIHKSFLDEMRRIYPDAEWAGDIEIDDDRNANRLQIRSRFKLAKFAARNDDGWAMFHRPLNIGTFFAPPQSTKRRAPYALAYPLNSRFHFEVHLPEGVSMIGNDRTKTVRDAYFSAKQTRRETGNVAEADYELVTLKPEVPAADMETFSADLRKAVEQFRTGLYVGDDEIHKASYAKLSAEEAFAKTQQDRLKQKIEKLSGAIDKGLLSGSDLAYAYTERASARSILGDAAGAKTDIEHALQASPDQESTLSTRGEILFHDAEFEKSLASFTRALSLGGDPADVYYRRAINYVMLGRYPEALADLQKAIDSDSDEERIPYQLLWYALTAARAGQPLPESIRTKMRQDSHGHWPRPLLGMFGGETSPGDVLSTLQAKKGDERLLQACEAHFFIGEYHLGKGDTASAKKAFEASLQTRAILYIEYDAAKHELKRIAAN